MYQQVGSSSADKVFRVWDTKTHQEIKAFSVGALLDSMISVSLSHHTCCVYLPQSCADGIWKGGLLLTFSSEQGTISLWEGRSLAHLAEAYTTFQVGQSAPQAGSL